MPRPRKPEDKKKKKVSITLDAQLLEELKKTAYEQGLSLSELIEDLLKHKIPWDIQEFGKFIQLINTYNGEKVDYFQYINPFSTSKAPPYTLHNKTLTLEFQLKNSKGKKNKYKATIYFDFCPECPGPYIHLRLYGWDDKKQEWFEMGEASTWNFKGEDLFNKILEIRRNFWLKLNTFRKEKEKKKKQRQKN